MMKPEPELVCRSAHGPCIDMLMLTRAGAALAAASAMKLDVRHGGGAASRRRSEEHAHQLERLASSCVEWSRVEPLDDLWRLFTCAPSH